MTSNDLSALARSLRFSADELAMNRSGRASPAQLARLQKDRKRGRAFLVFVLLVVVAFAVVAVVVVIPKLKKADDDSGSSSSVPVVPTVIAVFGLVLLLMLFSLLRSRRSLDRIGAAQIRQVSGPVETRARRMHGNVVDTDAPGTGSGGGMRYEVTIDRIRFFVAGQSVLDAFVDGAPYRAYYVAGGNRVMNVLLSAEPLRDQPPRG